MRDFPPPTAPPVAPPLGKKPADTAHYGGYSRPTTCLLYTSRPKPMVATPGSMPKTTIIPSVSISIHCNDKDVYKRQPLRYRLRPALRPLRDRLPPEPGILHLSRPRSHPHSLPRPAVRPRSLHTRYRSKYDSSPPRYCW